MSEEVETDSDLTILLLVFDDSSDLNELLGFVVVAEWFGVVPLSLMAFLRHLARRLLNQIFKNNCLNLSLIELDLRDKFKLGVLEFCCRLNQCYG